MLLKGKDSLAVRFIVFFGNCSKLFPWLALEIKDLATSRNLMCFLFELIGFFEELIILGPHDDI
jgi:hypothetical protein